MKYKAFIVKSKEVVRDVNHLSWKTDKTKVVELKPCVSQKSSTIAYQDVLYDVDYASWKIANVRIADDKLRAEAQTDEENLRWFKRQYKIAIQHIYDMLNTLAVKQDVADDSDNTISFLFPVEWAGNIDVLAGYMHHYVVDYILAQWFAMTMPDEANRYMLSVEAWKGKIIEEAHSENNSNDWFERQLATAVDHLKGKLRWCIREHLGTIVDNTIKKKELVYGDCGYPEVKDDCASFDDDIAFLDAPSEREIPIPEHVFRFMFSDAWRGNFESLCNYIHRYIVDYILHEYYKQTLPNEATVYLTSAEAWESKVVNEARSEDVSNVYFRL